MRSKLVGEALGRSGTDASTGDDAQKQRQVDGLDEVLVVAGGDASLSIGLLTVPCQGHEIRLLAAEVCTDSRGELVTAHDGHTDVDHRNGGVESREHGQRVEAIVRRGDLMACATQKRRQEIERVFVVVDEHDPLRSVRSREKERLRKTRGRDGSRG